MRWWRGVVGVLLLAAAMVGLPGGTDSAEALTRVRARINWSPVVPYLPTLRGYERFIEENPAQAGATFTFFRDNTLSRRSNVDPQLAQVLPGIQFTDRLRFTPTIDVLDAVLHVHQPAYGASPGQCHVVVTQVVDKFGQRAGPAIPDGASAEVALGRLSAASAPYEVTLVSQVPTESQLKKPTAKMFTSVVRVLERVPSRATTTPPPPRLRPCGGEIGGRGFINLNRTLVVRTELQLNEWAVRNNRATPTPVSRSG